MTTPVWNLEQRVARQADDRLSTIMETAESDEIKVKWDPDATSCSRWNPESHIRPMELCSKVQS